MERSVFAGIIKGNLSREYRQSIFLLDVIFLRMVHKPLLEVGFEITPHSGRTLEVVLVFRPVCSLFKVDQGFISGC
jgi:hypothetical protein